MYGEKMKMLGTKVLVETQETENTTESGLVFVTTMSPIPDRGIVRGVGPEVCSDGVSEGDLVVFNNRVKHQEVVWEGKTHLIMDEESILAVLS